MSCGSRKKNVFSPFREILTNVVREHHVSHWFVNSFKSLVALESNDELGRSKRCVTVFHNETIDSNPARYKAFATYLLVQHLLYQDLTRG